MGDKRKYDLKCEQPDETMPYIREFEKRLQDEEIRYKFEWDVDRSAIFYIDIDNFLEDAEDNFAVVITISGEGGARLLCSNDWLVPFCVKEKLFEKILSDDEYKYEYARFSIEENEEAMSELYDEEGCLIQAQYCLPYKYDFSAYTYAKMLYLAWLDFTVEVTTFDKNFCNWLKEAGIAERPRLSREKVIRAVSNASGNRA